MKFTIRYVGDLHCDAKHFAFHDRAARDAGIRHVVQCGDLGALYTPSRSNDERWKLWRDVKGPVPWDRIVSYCRSTRNGEPGPWPVWITPGGNHDNWPRWRDLPEKDGLRELAPGLFFADRGTIVRIDGVDHLFFGGARSVDAHLRIPGLSWWPEEIPTPAECEHLFETYDERKPAVVVAHDCPMDATPDGSRAVRNNSRLEEAVPKMLQSVMDSSAHSPQLWVFGHHHIVTREFIANVEYLCCGWKRDHVDVAWEVQPDREPAPIDIELHQIDRPDTPRPRRP